MAFDSNYITVFSVDNKLTLFVALQEWLQDHLQTILLWVSWFVWPHTQGDYNKNAINWETSKSC